MVEYPEEIKELEDKIAKTKYNKSTQHAVGLMKAKLAKLKEKQESRGSGGKKPEGYDVRKNGDGTVILIGFPSVGKSTLLNDLTNAESKIAAYAFTTLTVIPGTLHYQDAKIQILDVPGIVRGAAAGTGRGREVLAVMRSAELAVLIIDVNQPEHYDALLKEIRDAHIRINQEKPEVKITKQSTGGIKVAATVTLTKIDVETIKAICKEFRLMNADIIVRADIDADGFIDALEGNKKYIPALTVINKIDLATEGQVKRVVKLLNADLAISAKDKIYIEQLKELIFERLDLIRIYLKEPGKEADMKVPLIVRRKSKIEDICNKLHKEFALKFKFCRVWGKSSKFPGQRLMLDHKLLDRDVVEIHLR
ncbi:MAG: GTPase [Candidatus Woesearchaeota archaeon]